MDLSEFIEAKQGLGKLFFRVDLDSKSHFKVVSTGNNYVEVGGQVVIEAENYSTNTQNGDGVTWLESVEGSRTFIDTASAANNDWVSSVKVAYMVNFSTVGEYYIHPLVNAASSSNDSIYFGLADTFLGVANHGQTAGWVWDNNESEKIVITSPGVYEIQIRRRESGLKLDRFVLTTDTNASFSGDGPVESARE